MERNVLITGDHDDIESMLKNQMFKINTTGSGCCGYHITLARLKLALQSLYRSYCKPEYKPDSSWQCAYCFSMNSISYDEDFDDEICYMCGCGAKILPSNLSN